MFVWMINDPALDIWYGIDEYEEGWEIDEEDFGPGRKIRCKFPKN